LRRTLVWPPLPDIFIDYEEAEAVLEPWIAAIDAHLKSRSKQSVGGGRKGLPSWYGETKRADLRPSTISRNRGAVASARDSGGRAASSPNQLRTPRDSPCV
jgi:hypothetical protein